VAIADRVHIIESILRSIYARHDDFASAIHRETGKTLQEAEQEIDATAVETRVQLDLFSDGLAEEIAGYRVAHEALGPALLITPSNFPLAATLRKLVPAILAGNTAVVKASELTPITAQHLFEVIDGVELPAGVANLVLADGGDVVPAMIETAGLAAVSLTGSNTAGEAIARAIGVRNIRYQAEMGGSNAVVVLADADIDATVTAVAEHGFACAGQWCTGTARVVVEASVYDDFRQRLADRVGEIEIGSDMGAMISEPHRQRVEEAVLALCADGAKVIRGGCRPHGEKFDHGCFFEPTIIEASTNAEFDEIFGPVVVLLRAASAENALAIANTGHYGLSFSVFTRDEDKAEEIVAGAQAGMCHINLGTGFRDNALPLSGWSQSGRGLPECGTYAREFFTQIKTIYRAG
jgi:aldehyde dehydrogenase (NAD+)